MTAALQRLAVEVSACRRCPRLTAWREQVARERRAAFRDEVYWGRPIPGFGDPKARLLLLGLAPAAHGGNRTGRIFTGDRSGDFLFASMWRTGLSNQPTSRSLDDGLRLQGAWVTAAVRCAPPGNKPTAQERDNCLPWTVQEMALLPRLKAILCLGGFAWDAALRLLGKAEAAQASGASAKSRVAGGASAKRRVAGGASAKPRFGHGAIAEWGGMTLIGCYHPSQQNTFTGRLTPEMLDEVLLQAKQLAGL